MKQFLRKKDVVAVLTEKSTGNDRYSGHGYSGIHRYSGTKRPDDAILFTVSGITAIVEQKFQIFTKILMRCSIFTVV